MAAGDILTIMHDNAGNRARIEAKTREILSSPAVPILLGGDDSVVSPFLAGFADHGPVWILQIDAHIDWRDEVHGERYGYSSPMRRASEMAHVAGMVQVGLRSVGSARLTEIEAARHYGSRFVTAREVHALGVEAALRHIPEGARVVVTFAATVSTQASCLASPHVRPAASPIRRSSISSQASASGRGSPVSILWSSIRQTTLTACRRSPPRAFSSM